MTYHLKSVALNDSFFTFTDFHFLHLSRQKNLRAFDVGAVPHTIDDLLKVLWQAVGKPLWRGEGAFSIVALFSGEVG